VRKSSLNRPFVCPILNNDFYFVEPDLSIVVSDALRAGHGLDYYPGETNFRAADILVIK
jgi:predicted GTPase